MSTKHTLHFLVAGSQKAGTTSLHQFFQNSGLVNLPQKKETNFWDYRYDPDLSKYWRLFDLEEDLCTHFGEVAPHYWLKAVAGKRLAQAFPDLKVIMVIRDPVDRAYSAYNMYQKNKRFESYTRQSFAKTLALEKSGQLTSNLLLNGDYNKHLPQFLKNFEPSNVLVVRFEHLVRNQSEALEEILRFLDLPISGESYTLPEENHSGIPRNRLSYILFNALGLSRPLRSLLGRGLITKLKAMFFTKPTGMSDLEKEQLKSAFFEGHSVSLEQREDALWYGEYRVI